MTVCRSGHRSGLVARGLRHAGYQVENLDGVITLTSGAALAAHLASGSIDWTIASTFTGAAIAGALAGRRLGATVRPERLGRLFALLLVAIAVFLVAKNAAAAV